MNYRALFETITNYIHHQNNLRGLNITIKSIIGHYNLDDKTFYKVGHLPTHIQHIIGQSNVPIILEDYYKTLIELGIPDIYIEYSDDISISFVEKWNESYYFVYIPLEVFIID